MGYYDSHYSDPETPKSSGNRKGWFWSGLLGAIIGIIVFFVLSPFLASQGWLPSYNQNNASTQVTGPTTNKTVNVDVHSAVIDAVNKVSPAVVAVINMQSANFFDNKYTEAGIGSGIVYKKSGDYAYVVTNNHVVEGANKVEVRFDDQTKVDAELLGKDSLYDLAVLRIPAKYVKVVASFGNSDKLKLGEPVVAIGNPLGFSGTVTQGIVSSANRSIQRTVQTNGGQVNYNAQVIQTDAAINPGNSGGALVNLAGQVVGINSLKIAETSVEGIGFAIPINIATPVINQLETKGKIERPYLGISLVGLDELPASAIQQLKVPDNVKGGIVVTAVSPGSPAQRAGIKEGDLIVQIDDYKVKNYVDFSTYLYTNLKVGQKVKVKVYRYGKLKTLEMTLGGKVFS
ncbi:S1C family serine protease [Tuberibacillus calidus]|uniref:S1C family serine protease n=1 Tax=Tuberibacillus calidus TaxID=340097 RepID=UPI0004279473|nr:trypsin-like peptidase domain-containing protein [Tuberibacillus calidus]